MNQDENKDSIDWYELHKEASYSPIEILLYYLAYPQQLFKDVYRKYKYLSSENINNYISECYNSAIKYHFEKYKNN